MRRVGVITMHYVRNYGSALQAFATQKIIEKLGYDCEIIDYTYPNKFQYERGRKHTTLSLKSKVARFLNLKPGHRKYNRVGTFLRKNLHLTRNYKDHDDLMANPPSYDIYVTGSDQVWNPLHMYGDSVFFLKFAPEGSCKVAFSSSFALKSIPEQYVESYKAWLSEYRHISVREKNGTDIIKSLIGRDVPVTLDPTLMLSSNDWISLLGRKRNPYKGKKYILLYMLGYAFDPEPYIYEVVKELQAKTGLDVYTLSPPPKDFFYNNLRDCSDVSPVGFIELFEYASYVVTSSFHGTAFAVNFGVPLYSIVNNDGKKEDDRQRTLLEMLGLQNCIVEKGTPMNTINPRYDIKTKDQALDDARRQSLEYISNALKQE